MMQPSSLRSDFIDFALSTVAPVFIGISQYSPIPLFKNTALHAALLTYNNKSVKKLLDKHSYRDTQGYLTRRIFEGFLNKHISTELLTDYLSDKPCIDLDDLLHQRMCSLWSPMRNTSLDTLLTIINSGCLQDNIKMEFWFAVHYCNNTLTQQEQTVLCDAMYDKFQDAYVQFLTDEHKQFQLSSTQSTDNFTHIFAQNASVSTLCSFIETNAAHFTSCAQKGINSSILYNFTQGLLKRQQPHSLIDLITVFDQKNLLPFFCQHVNRNFEHQSEIPDYKYNLFNFTTTNLKLRLINTFLEYNEGKSNIILTDLHTYKEVLQSSQQRENLLQALEQNSSKTAENCVAVEPASDCTATAEPHLPPVRKRKM